jgi:3-deoxy-7-phosphoheptulonate synthase
MDKILSPNEILKSYPLSNEQRKQVASYRQEIVDILQGNSSKILLIVGPCSIHDLTAARQYAKQLKTLQERIQNDFFIVMRTYLEKSRTAFGWKGFVHDPYLDGSNRIDQGIRLSRSFLLELIDLGIPAGCEFLEPLSHSFFSDCISWGSIGARCVQSPVHRELASALAMPVGMKNRTDGNIDVAIQAIRSAQKPHTFFSCDMDGKLCSMTSRGNVFPHLVLRGGDTSENYSPYAIQNAATQLQSAGLSPRLIVDCSHGNSKKNANLQMSVYASLMHEIHKGNTHICGIMLESFLHEGSQATYLQTREPLQYGVSITDPCLDWKTTEQLIYTSCNIQELVEVLS